MSANHHPDTSPAGPSDDPPARLLRKRSAWLALAMAALVAIGTGPVAAVVGASDNRAGGPPTWDHETVTAPTAAVAWIQRDIAAGSGSSLRISGTGWVDTAGTRGSTVAIKLNRGPNEQYTRSGAAIVVHPTAPSDDTIWALLSMDGTDHPNVHPIAADGSFEVVLDAPPGLVAGQHLSVLMQSGRFLPGDVLRTVTSAPLVVGGVPWVDTSTTTPEGPCTPTSVVTTAEVTPAAVEMGAAIRLTGEGWCHPGNGGSVVAVKIDDGAFSRPDSAVHQNRTIWAIVEADPHTGRLDAEIVLPDGSESSSTPALTEGSHSLRLLSGSLKNGDLVRTVETGAFTVGAYRPNGTPPPVEAGEDLTESTRNGVRAVLEASALVVTVPGLAEGDWAFLTLFEGPSPRYPWPQWFQAGPGGRIVASRAGVTLPSGTVKVSVQSDRRDSGGRHLLLGWDTVVVPGVPPGSTVPPSTPRPPTVTPTVPPSGGTSPGDGPGLAPGQSGVSPAPTDFGSVVRPGTGSARPAVVAPRSVTSPPPIPAGAPALVPDPPARNYSLLAILSNGDLSATAAGSVVTVSTAGAAPGSWVYVYVYASQGSAPIPVGWLPVGPEGTVSLDLSRLAADRFRVAVLGAGGDLLGWTEVDLTSDDDATVEPVPEGSGDAASDPDAAVTLPAARGVVEASARSGIGDTDLVLVALGVAVIGFGVVTIRRRPSASSSPTPPASGGPT